MYSFNYNGYTLQNNSNINIEDTDGLDSLEIRTSEDFLTGDHGGNIWEQKYGMRTIKIAGSIYADNISDYFTMRRAIASAFSLAAGSSLLTVIAPDGEVRTAYARVIDKPVSFKEEVGESAQCKFLVLLKADNPFLLDNDEQIATAVLGDSGGSPVSTPIPTPISGISENLLVINNTGDIPYWAKFTIHGDVVNPTITNLSTGEFFRLNTTFSSLEGAILEQDQEGLSVTNLNGDNIFSVFEGDFFQMGIGTNTLRFTASSSSPNASVVVSFYNRYLSI